MPTDVLDATEIRNRREVIERRLAAIKRALETEEDNLDKLQKLCTHPDKKNQWSDARGTYWFCDDCDMYWFVKANSGQPVDEA